MATPFPFTAGNVLTAAQLNSIGAYTAYTPTFGGFTLGNGTINTRYTQVNKMVHYYGRVTLGSTSVMTGPLDVGVPFNINAASTIIDPIGVASGYNGSLIAFAFPINLFNASFRMVFSLTNGTYATSVDVGAGVPFVWAAGNYFQWNVTYESV